MTHTRFTTAEAERIQAFADVLMACGLASAVDWCEGEEEPCEYAAIFDRTGATMLLTIVRDARGYGSYDATGETLRAGKTLGQVIGEPEEEGE